MIGIIIYSLFVFWSCGVIGVLIDIDHIFVLAGRKSPIKLGDSYGRPFHSRIIFTLVAIGVSLAMVTFIDGLFKGILFGLGEGGTILFLVIVIITTGLITKKVGNNFGDRLREQRKLWRNEHIQKQRGL